MTSQALPEHASTVVIGGGIMGCSTLYHLAKMGVSDAILLERNKLTSGTTWHSAAQVRALRHSQNLTRMIQYSIDLYSQLEVETGQQVGWIQKGSLSIATTPDRLTHIKRQEALAHAFGVTAQSISAAAAAEHWPLMRSDDVLGAVWSPDDGRVSPSDVCAALAKGARTKGARIFEDTGVTGILTRNGKIAGVETASGMIRCDAIALCAGLWSRDIAAMAGADAPLLACEHFYLLTKPVDGITGNMPTLSDHDRHLYIRDDSGGLLVGCFEPMGKPIAPGTLSPDFAFGLLPEDWDHFEPMMENALHRLPPLETAEVKMLLNGPESFTPDGMFMLGEAAETQGLFFGTGMNSVGVASGGGAGMNLAHAIVHGHTAYDLGEADAKRFAPVFNRIEHLMDRAPEILGTHYEIALPGRQLSTARNLRTGPLDAEHRQAGAVTGQFFGWERPLYFGPAPARLTFERPDWHDCAAAEVSAAHGSAAIFDLSTFGNIDVRGPDAKRYMSHVCAGRMARSPGTVIYSAVLNERGTFESDVTVQRLSAEHYRVFTGTAAIRRDLSWFRRHASGYEVAISDTTSDIATLALMGPASLEIARSLGGETIAEIPYFSHAEVQLAGVTTRAARMSYVGEAGWELSCAADQVATLYRSLCNAGARPAGLYAQTSMRIEKGFLAMGHELDSDVSPMDVGLQGALAKGGAYLGADALSQRPPPKRRIATLIFDDVEAVPLGGEPVYAGDRVIGRTTSAAFGHRIGRPVALAFVEAVPQGAEVEVDIARHRTGVHLQGHAAFDPDGTRMKPRAMKVTTQ